MEDEGGRKESNDRTFPHLTESQGVHSCDVLPPFQSCEVSVWKMTHTVATGTDIL